MEDLLKATKKAATLQSRIVKGGMILKELDCFDAVRVNDRDFDVPVGLL